MDVPHTCDWVIMDRGDRPTNSRHAFLIRLKAFLDLRARCDTDPALLLRLSLFSCSASCGPTVTIWTYLLGVFNPSDALKLVNRHTAALMTLDKERNVPNLKWTFWTTLHVFSSICSPVFLLTADVRRTFREEVLCGCPYMELDDCSLWRNILSCPLTGNGRPTPL